jgi:hypothetical protein
MVVRLRLVLLFVSSLLAWACTVNPDPIPGGGDATMMPMADATDSHDAYWPSTDDLQGLPDGSTAGDGPSGGDGPTEGGPDEGGLAGDGDVDGGPTDADPMDAQPDS